MYPSFSETTIVLYCCSCSCCPFFLLRVSLERCCFSKDVCEEETNSLSKEGIEARTFLFPSKGIFSDICSLLWRLKNKSKSLDSSCKELLWGKTFEEARPAFKRRTNLGHFISLLEKRIKFLFSRFSSNQVDKMLKRQCTRRRDWRRWIRYVVQSRNYILMRVTQWERTWSWSLLRSFPTDSHLFISYVSHNSSFSFRWSQRGCSSSSSSSSFPCATKKRQTGRKLTFYRRGNQVYTCQVLVQILFTTVVSFSSSLSLHETTTDKERSDRRFLSLDCHPLFPYLLLLSWCCKDAYTTTTGRSYHWKQQQVHTLNISHREWIRRRHWKETGNECDSWGFFSDEKITYPAFFFSFSCLVLYKLYILLSTKQLDDTREEEREWGRKFNEIQQKVVQEKETTNDKTEFQRLSVTRKWQEVNVRQRKSNEYLL